MQAAYRPEAENLVAYLEFHSMALHSELQSIARLRFSEFLGHMQLLPYRLGNDQRGVVIPKRFMRR